MKTLTAIAAQHEVDPLKNAKVPTIELLSTNNEAPVDLKRYIGDLAVLFFYPATGVPGRDPAFDPAPGWDDIPGAAGCTPESCAFRDSVAKFNEFGVSIFGVSTQPLDEQIEFKQRKHIPYPLISDSGLTLAERLGIPIFAVGGKVFFKRLTLVIKDGVILKVFREIPETDKHAAEVLDWLRKNSDH